MVELQRYRMHLVGPGWIDDVPDAQGQWVKADSALARITALEADLAAARAIIDKLPTTADGVPVVPGMTVWYLRDGLPPERNDISGFQYGESQSMYCPDTGGTVFFSPRGHSSIWRWDRAYSTEAAALAAKRGGQ